MHGGQGVASSRSALKKKRPGMKKMENKERQIKARLH
jgi:hypothetical protein